ncbi:MAG: hypothetical protein H7Y06_06500 [Opitutaceae bacterium]|nr:hypothetical protein [Opitutaceae bacterium]
MITDRLRLLSAFLALGAVALAAEPRHSLFGDPTPPVGSATLLDDLIVTPVVWEKLPRKPFKVSRVGEPNQPKREALVALFSAFQSQYSLDDSAKIVPAAPWTGTTLATLSTTLRQDAVEGLYLLGASAAHCVVFKPTAPEPLVIGTKLKIFVYQSGTQTWLDPQGSEQKSPLYQELVLPLKDPTPRPPARDHFLEALRSGQKFDVLTQEGDTLVVQVLEW